VTFGSIHAKMQLVEWENWQCALLVAQLGTVAAAAARLNVDATTVSRRVKRLEAKLGARIFERHGLRLHATNSFREALANVEAADTALRSAEEAVGHPSSKVFQRTVRITAVPFLVDYLLVPGLTALRRQANFRIELVADNRNLSLTRREADVAVRFDSPRERKGGDAQRLGAVGYAVYAAAKAKPADLPWATLEDAYAHLPEARWTARTSGKLKPDFKASRTETIREIVAVGLAKALLPQLMGEQDRRLVRISDENVLSREVGLIRPFGESAMPHLDVVTKWLKKLFTRPEATALGIIAPGSQRP
jgi:DNA-binding transcriptional LysR family regulator